MHLSKPSLALFFILTFMINCTYEHRSDSVSATKKSLSKLSSSHTNLEFKKFISKFKLLKTPFLSNEDDFQNVGHLQVLTGSDFNYAHNTKLDTVLDKEYAYGMLSDTSNDYKLIWLTPTAVYSPMLTIFSKSGQKISEKFLSVGMCGSDCCFNCKEFISIKKDLSIYCADSITACECDSTGPKPSTTRKYVLFKTGKIEKNGRVTLSKMYRKD